MNTYIESMKKGLIISLVAGLAASPSLAQEPEDGLSLMERGAKLFMEGVMTQMQPTLEDLRDKAEELEPQMRQFIEDMGPALGEMISRMGDVTQYAPPEMLPNGDIILRRKTPIEPAAPEVPKGEALDL